VKVRFKRSVNIRGVSYEAGRDYQVDDNLGLWLIDRGIADPVLEEEAPETPVQQAKPTTAYEKLLALTEAHLAEIYGSYGTGKSRLVHAIAVEAQNLGKRVVFIDTEGGLLDEHVKQLQNYWYVGDSIEALEDAVAKAKENRKDYDLLVVDSLPGYTPLILMDPQNKIHVTSIEDFFHMVDDPIKNTVRGEEFKDVQNWKVYEYGYKHGCWVPIKRVIRHPYDGELIRINAGSGLIDVSPNHPIVIGNGNFIEAEKITVGQRVSVPHFENRAKYHNSGLFIGSTDLAWLYGFFVADGCITNYHHPRGRVKDPTKGRTECVVFDNTNQRLIDRAIEVLDKELNTNAFCDEKTDGGIRVCCYGKEIYDHFKQFYTASKEKKIPYWILNSPERIKEAFISGYLDGDGHLEGAWTESQFSFSESSHSVIMGLLWMIKGLEGRSWSVLTRADKPKAVEVRVNKGKNNRKIDPRMVKKLDRLHYQGWLYDLEVEGGHKFSAGIGPIRVHNSVGHPIYVNYVELETMAEKLRAYQRLALVFRDMVRFARGERGVDLGERKALAIATNHTISEFARVIKELPEEEPLGPFGGQIHRVPKVILRSEPVELTGERSVFKLVSFKLRNMPKDVEVARFTISKSGVEIKWRI